MSEVITREAHWDELTQSEREALAEGFQDHLGARGLLPKEISVREVYELCEKTRVHITFFVKDGHEQFRLSLDKNKAFSVMLHKFIDKSLEEISKNQ